MYMFWKIYINLLLKIINKNNYYSNEFLTFLDLKYLISKKNIAYVIEFLIDQKNEINEYFKFP